MHLETLEVTTMWETFYFANKTCYLFDKPPDIFRGNHTGCEKDITVLVTGKEPDLPKKQLEAYVLLITDYIKKVKGWEPKEYYIRYDHIDPDVPVAIFGAIRRDTWAKIRAEKIKTLDFHLPEEMRIFIHAKEMCVFSDYHEYFKMREEAEKTVRKNN